MTSLASLCSRLRPLSSWLGAAPNCAFSAARALPKSSKPTPVPQAKATVLNPPPVTHVNPWEDTPNPYVNPEPYPPPKPKRPSSIPRVQSPRALLSQIEQEQVQKFANPHVQLDKISPGDHVVVKMYSNSPGDKKITVIPGVILGRRNKGYRSTIMMRCCVGEDAVEYIIPVHSPWLVAIELVKKVRYRRAKVYYLRRFPNQFFYVNYVPMRKRKNKLEAAASQDGAPPLPLDLKEYIVNIPADSADQG